MDLSRLLPRALLVLLALASAATALAVVRGLVAERVAPPRPAVAAPATRGPVAVLHAWDDRRARAWARGDVRALRSLYVPGSLGGRRDVAMLAAWNARGLRVRGLRMQVLAADVRTASRRRVRLVVTDRVADAVATGTGGAVPLPRDTASTRTVVLERVAGEWRVVAVRPGGQPAR